MIGTIPVRAGFGGSRADPEQLAQGGGVRAGLVDSYGPSAPDALLDDQAAVGESIDFAHHRRRVDVERTGEVGEGAPAVVVEEQLDEQTTLRVTAEDRQ